MVSISRSKRHRRNFNQAETVIDNTIPPLAELTAAPERIVCLTDETVEVLYRLGEQERVVGVSGFACRPKEARRKPRVSAFTSAKIDKILDLRPDLVIGFSNLQADIARDLIRAGINTLIFNQRSVAEILQMIATLARIIGVESAGLKLVAELRGGLDEVAASAQRFSRRPRVYFEEWMEPLISGIRWVEELIEIAGGEPVFPHLRHEQDAARRVVNADEVAAAAPDVIIASWCGRKVNKAVIRSRPGWEKIPAVRDGHIYEVKSTYILQPGPAALTEGVLQLHTILARVTGRDPLPGLSPSERIDPSLDPKKRGRESPDPFSR
jgi:iron complex transport system substrate-binding protein